MTGAAHRKVILSSRKVRPAAAAVSGLVATASAVVGIWLAVFPHGDKPAPTAAIEGAVHVRDLVSQVRLATFLHENGLPAKQVTRKQLDFQGVEAFVQVRLTGVTDRPSLFWTLYQRSPRKPLGGKFAHQNGGEVPTLSNAYQGIAKVWVPWPDRPGVYFARIELDYKDATLDFVDSKPFGVIGVFLPPVTGSGPQPSPPLTVPVPHVMAAFTKTKGS